MKRVAVALMLLLFVASIALAITGREIVEKMRAQETYEDAVTKVKMELINPQGKKRTRILITRYKEKDGLTRATTTFVYPDDVKGTKFLVIEEKKGETTQYLFLPALGKVRKITAKERGGSFMGSDFSYADLQPHDPEKGIHKLVREEKCGEHECYVVESTPKPGEEDFEYSKVTYWVRKDNYYPIKAVFHDKKGNLLKQLTVEEIAQTPDGVWYAKKSVMENLRTHHKTVLEIQEIRTNAGIPDEFFTLRFLEDKTRL